MVALTALLLPILLSAVALFFASFVSWMVVPNHNSDWGALPNEDGITDAIRSAGVAPGNYMFPYAPPKDRQSPEHMAKVERGPMGVITVFPGMTMGRNLGLTFLTFLLASACLAYLATLGLQPGATFREVFRFLSTAAFLTFATSVVQHAIWFRCRIVGHVLEAIVYAAIVGAISGAMWPAAQ